MGRAHLLALSLGAHAAVGLFLGSIPARKRSQVVAISIAETRHPKAPPKIEPLPEPEPPVTTAHIAKAKAAPAAKPVASPPPLPAQAAVSSMDALPDFGVSLSGGSSGGLAIARPAGPSVATPPAPTAKTLTRVATPKHDDCDEPPAKPKLLSRPTPVYTSEARAAGVAGKVRVEITVDEKGQIASVRLAQGLGHGLDEAALAAARGMTFEPAVRCGRATSATFKIGFTFAPQSP